ncbi:MAG: AAA family ATPase [Bacteroidaceae bacterium]|jgi:DNA sulfur modification protein DndD|nr:DNA sulfur modification protein DndD [Bacteroidaceae bacterium]
MYIESIILENYRIYKGLNTISFPQKVDKNIFVVSGDNGFGKTTFLTSLVWCLYGKQMSDVDDKFKREIAENGGYKNYAKLGINNSQRNISDSFEIDEDEKAIILKRGYSLQDSKHIEFKKNNEYSVTVVLSEVLIPSVPCNQITIKRTFDFFRGVESVEILIDGRVNELSKDVGTEIFINDFILSKDIAKFFFFDSEKIVSLAEMKSSEDKKRLSIAYSEVLGVKKYEDLKSNLENLRIKLRRKSSDVSDKNKLNKLIKEAEELQKLLSQLIEKQNHTDEEIVNKRLISEQYQEKLIREGNSISLSELSGLKALRDSLRAKDLQLKNDLRELLDLAPFAIAGKKLVETLTQTEYEQKHLLRDKNTSIIMDKLKDVQNELFYKIRKANLSSSMKEEFEKIISNTFENQSAEENLEDQNGKLLIDFTSEEQSEFQSIYENIKYSYNQVFKQLVKDEKNNRLFLNKTIRKITQAESNDDDLLIKELRVEKAKVEKQIAELEKDARKTSENIGVYQKELSVKSKLITELSKRVSLEEIDKQKDDLAERLISELNEFLLQLKSEKKISLEISIKHELNKLMHKSDFVNNVKVDIQEDLIDIHLFNKEGQEINKETLSKGEQQLYATGILKALVDESEINFPIFIDSPLQKFDKEHSKKIIAEFYPNISEQVVLFPLLGKELSEEEYEQLLPFVNKSYIIRNNNQNSWFEDASPKELFNKVKEGYVHSY